MNSALTYSNDLSESYREDVPDGSAIYRSTALSNKLTSVLSASYADSEIRAALQALDLKNVQNTSEVRRRLRQDVQKEVIECNREVIDDFGQIVEVGYEQGHR